VREENPCSSCDEKKQQLFKNASEALGFQPEVLSTCSQKISPVASIIPFTKHCMWGSGSNSLGNS
jgi:hypothetical protein